MTKMQYIFGPVPSRRLGVSLGVSPIPQKTCNYSCIYCQLGRTNHMTNKRKLFFPVKDIVREFELVLSQKTYFDVVTIVGEGEPTLYLALGELIAEIKRKTDKPVVVITNGSLLANTEVQKQLSNADIVLPSLDAYDTASFKKINRSHGGIDYSDVIQGLVDFSHNYHGQLWLEIMLMKDINDDLESLEKYGRLLKKIRYDKLYLNTPVRPPAEAYVQTVDHEKMEYASKLLGGVSIDLLASSSFHSEISDDYEAILSIIKRHPMNQYEIRNFLISRSCGDIDRVFTKLENDDHVTQVSFKGYNTYRLQ